MTDAFREAAKAAGYVGSGLTHDFPGATAEVIRTTGRGDRQCRCSVDEVENILTDLCKGFGQSFVDYHPNNVYGFVAEIRSGAVDSSRPTPRIFVLLKEVNGSPISVGSTPSKRTPFELD